MDMRVMVAGAVVEVEARQYTKQDGSVVRSWDAYLASENPRYGADRISGPPELAPGVGEFVGYLASVSARASSPTGRPYLSAWCVEKLPPAVVAAIADARVSTADPAAA